MTAACLPPPGAPDVLYAVDLPGLVHRHFHGRPPVVSSAGERVEAVRGVLSDLRRVIAEQRPAFLALAVECPVTTPGEPEGWRNIRYTMYKATRRAEPRPPELAPQEALIRAIVDAMRIPVLEAPGFEADDGLAVAAARAEQAGLACVVVTGDKDLGALVGPRCLLWNLAPMGRAPAVVGVDEVRERWGVGPELLGDLLALAGDEGDDVPGVPGIGAGKAAALLQTHGNLGRVLRNAGGVKGKMGENLRAHRAAAVMSRQLVALRADAPVAWDLAEMRIGGFDVAAVVALFERIGVDSSSVRATKKAPVPLEVLERDAAWDPTRALAGWCALEAELLAALASGTCDAGHNMQLAQVVKFGETPGAQSDPGAVSDAAPLSWRDLVLWPGPGAETLRRTPVGRWDVLAGRWATLRPVAHGAPPVVVRVLESLGPPPGDGVDLDSRPRARVEVWAGGVCHGEHEVPSGVVDRYLTEAAAAELRGTAASNGTIGVPSIAPSAAPAGEQISLF